MKPKISPIGSHPTDLIEGVIEEIRTVSFKARQVAITPGSLLLEELALDSLDLVAVVLQLQDRFQVELDPDDLPDLQCVGDLVSIISDHLRAAA